MDMNQVIKYLKYLDFKQTILHRIESIYTLDKYQIMFSYDEYRVRNMYMYYDNIELYKVPVSYISTQDIMYTLVNIFELGVENMNKVKDKITDTKCIEKIKRYEQSKNNITLNTSDRTSFVVNDKNVIFLLDDNIPVHVIKRDEKLNQILEEYHFKNKKQSINNDSNKFIHLKALLDRRINEENIKRNILFEFNTALINIGFKAYKNNTIFKYTDNIRIVIKDKTIELYYFGHKQSFEINGYILTKIIEYISSIEEER